MKNVTKATGICAIIGGIGAAVLTIVGAAAKNKDLRQTEVENEIDDLDNTEVTEDEITDQPEEAETEEPTLEGEIE